MGHRIVALGGHETLLRFKLRNAEPPDVEFAYANGAWRELFRKEALFVFESDGSPPRFMQVSPPLA